MATKILSVFPVPFTIKCFIHSSKLILSYTNLAYPTAIGKAGSYFEIPLEKLLIAFLQSFVSNLINVGIKHIPLGQSEGQKILINLLPVIEKQVKINKIAQINNLGSCAFLSDLSSMYHETLINRIYQT